MALNSDLRSSLPELSSHHISPPLDCTFECPFSRGLISQSTLALAYTSASVWSTVDVPDHVQHRVHRAALGLHRVVFHVHLKVEVNGVRSSIGCEDMTCVGTLSTPELRGEFVP